MDIKDYMHTLGQQARDAAAAMARASTRAKNAALSELARLLLGAGPALQEANARDIAAAEAAGLSAPMVDRLRLTEKVIATMAEGCDQLAAMPDPVGEITGVKRRPTGISVGQMRVPLGVFGMIYESRPNVTIEAASLAIKSGNACILRGGKGLIERVSREAKVPVIKHLDGNCHTYVDAEFDLEKALVVTENAKTQKYSPCNATESLLVHERAAAAFLPRIGEIFSAKGVEMRCDAVSKALLASVPGAQLVDATEEDWFTEYLAPIISVKIVASLDEAIDHINRYSSHHTDAILTTNHPNAMQFLREVDSSSVMVNASTRFADGFEYGLGAEIGISTDKIHARGPVGLEGLTSQKWVVLGDGHVRG